MFSRKNQFLLLLFASTIFFAVYLAGFTFRKADPQIKVSEKITQSINLPRPEIKKNYIADLKKTPESDSGDELSSDMSSSFRGNPAHESGKDVITLAFAGDVMLGRSVMQKYLELNDYTYPFQKVADRLKKADLVFVNLENPIIADCPIHTGGFKFCSPPQSIEYLLFAGVDVVTLANNHSANYGEKGIEDTINFLENEGILATGIGRLVTKGVRGTKFGFLGFNKAQQTNPLLTPSEIDLIRESDRKVDVLIIAMHWGVEYQNTALPGVSKLAKDLVAMGADVVVGHHTHWVQNSELINGPPWKDGSAYARPVYYSLGNFIFDQMWSEETRKGLLVVLTYEDGKFIKEDKYKTYIREIGQPEISEN